MEKYLLIAYGIWNVFVFLLYGLDKLKAKHNWWRISEKTLIGFAFLMGSLGAIFGRKVFHHKTLKTKFRILIPLAAIFNIGVIAAYIYYFYMI